MNSNMEFSLVDNNKNLIKKIYLEAFVGSAVMMSHTHTLQKVFSMWVSFLFFHYSAIPHVSHEPVGILMPMNHSFPNSIGDDGKQVFVRLTHHPDSPYRSPQIRT